jgi:hypothetical protein
MVPPGTVGCILGPHKPYIMKAEHLWIRILHVLQGLELAMETRASSIIKQKNIFHWGCIHHTKY